MILITTDKIKNIADQLDMGLTCYINKHNGELVYVINEDDLDLAFDEENMWADEKEKIENNPESYVKIEKMNSHESFSLTEEFIEVIDSENFKSRLISALKGKKPFRNFKSIVDDSDYRQSWFEFKDRKMQQYVKDQIDAINRKQ